MAYLGGVCASALSIIFFVVGFVIAMAMDKAESKHAQKNGG